MLTKYIKLSFICLAPVLTTLLYRVMRLSERWSGVTSSSKSSSSVYGNILYPSLPYFSYYFDAVILLLYLAAAMYCLFVFTELRSRDTGSFIASLPVKKATVFAFAFFSGLMFITLPFIPMGVYISGELKQAAPEVQAVFAAYNRLDWAEEIILTAEQDIRESVIRNYGVILCLYGLLMFTQTLFQKPLAALCAFVGGLGGAVLCLMTLDKYLIALGHRGIDSWFSNGYGMRFVSYLNTHFFGSDMPSLIRFMLLIMAITASMFFLGLLLYQKGGRRTDFIFTFPATKIIMHAGITLCSGCLAVYILFIMVGMNGLKLGVMNLFFVSGAAFAYFLTKKVLTILC